MFNLSTQSFPCGSEGHSSLLSLFSLHFTQIASNYVLCFTNCLCERTRVGRHPDVILPWVSSKALLIVSVVVVAISLCDKVSNNKSLVILLQHPSGFITVRTRSGLDLSSDRSLIEPTLGLFLDFEVRHDISVRHLCLLVKLFSRWLGLEHPTQVSSLRFKLRWNPLVGKLHQESVNWPLSRLSYLLR